MKINYTTKKLVTEKNVEKGKKVRVIDTAPPSGILPIEQRMGPYYDIILKVVGVITDYSPDKQATSVRFAIGDGKIADGHFATGHLGHYELEYVDHED